VNFCNTLAKYAEELDANMLFLHVHHFSYNAASSVQYQPKCVTLVHVGKNYGFRRQRTI